MVSVVTAASAVTVTRSPSAPSAARVAPRASSDTSTPVHLGEPDAMTPPIDPAPTTQIRMIHFLSQPGPPLPQPGPPLPQPGPPLPQPGPPLPQPGPPLPQPGPALRQHRPIPAPAGFCETAGYAKVGTMHPLTSHPVTSCRYPWRVAGPSTSFRRPSRSPWRTRRPRRSGWTSRTPPSRCPRWPPSATTDLAVVGGGFTGLWTALLAKERDPSREVILLEARTVGNAASGRNGGFCSASLTHGIANGLERFPAEMPLLEKLGEQNLTEIGAAIAAHDIDCDFQLTGELSVATAAWQLEGVEEEAAAARALGHDVEVLDGAGIRRELNSPVLVGGLKIKHR